jgi:hypothetical protein
MHLNLIEQVTLILLVVGVAPVVSLAEL